MEDFRRIQTNTETVIETAQEESNAATIQINSLTNMLTDLQLDVLTNRNKVNVALTQINTSFDKMINDQGSIQNTLRTVSE